MAAVTELAVDVGTSAACQALAVPRALTTGIAVRSCSGGGGLAAFADPSLRPAEREAVLSRLHEERFQDRFQPRCMRRCSMKGNTTVRSEPCIAYWNSVASRASAAIS